MVVAVLALQGAFAEHGQILDKLGVEHFEIRQKKDLDRKFDALILPGGESTVMAKLLRELELLELLREKIQSGMPVFGTCAGLILLAEEVEGEEKGLAGSDIFERNSTDTGKAIQIPSRLATMHIRVKRNAYGRQLGSFYTEAEFNGLGTIPMTFIRAPYITEVFDGAEVLAKMDGKIVAAKQGNQLVTAFHPELNGDTRVHEYFLNMI